MFFAPNKKQTASYKKRDHKIKVRIASPAEVGIKTDTIKEFWSQNFDPTEVIFNRRQLIIPLDEYGNNVSNASEQKNSPL